MCLCVSVCAGQRKVAKGQREASLTSSHLISFICLSRSEAAARPHCCLKVFGHGQMQLQQLLRSRLKSRLKTLHNLAVAATAVACGIWQLQLHSFLQVNSLQLALISCFREACRAILFCLRGVISVSSSLVWLR